MIDLTPLEVRKKKGDFRRQLRGYDPAQVDDFLDVVADRLEAVVRENLSVAERVARLEQQVTDYRDRERALTEALVTAQEMREEIRSQTSKEIELAKRQAVQDAERIRIDAEQDREREEGNVRLLRQRQRQLLHSFRTFLERELSELVVFSKALEMDDSVPVHDTQRRRSRRGSGAHADDEDSRTEAASTAGPSASTLTSGAVAAEAARRAEPPIRETRVDEPVPPRPEPVAYVPPPAELPLSATPEEAAASAGPPALQDDVQGAGPDEPVAESAGPPLDGMPGVDLDRFDDATFGDLDPFGDMHAGPADIAERGVSVHDRPESTDELSEAVGPPDFEPSAQPMDAFDEPRAEGLGDVTEDDLGQLFSSWDAEDIEPAPVAEPAAQSVEELADELADLLKTEQELFLSDDDVLEDPGVEDGDLAALENVAGAETDEWDFEDELLIEEEVVGGSEPQPGDQPVDLSMLPDEDVAHLDLDDLGLPPLHQTPSDPGRGFGPSGLTLRPLSSEEDAPDVPRERSGDDDDDDDMFSTLFGKPR